MKKNSLFFAFVGITFITGSLLSQAESSFPQARYAVIEKAREAAETKMVLLHGLDGHEKNNKKSSYDTSHKDSYHTYSGISDYADLVELNDGSCWFVLPAERKKVLEWQVGDHLVILKGDKHSNYKYLLHNERLRQIVEVELKTPPDNFNRLTIKDINKEARYLFLSDGSKWTLPTNWFDQEVWTKWYIGDIIIIGTNDQFFYSWSNPDILINFTCSATHTPSKCMN